MHNVKEEQLKKYESALQLAFYEGQISWQMNVLFIALNVGIGSIIGNKLEKISDHPQLLIIMSIMGLIINFFWLGTFRRNCRYYNFRMAQARNAEPSGWKLVDEDGYKFSHGEKIRIESANIDGKDLDHKLSRLEKLATNKRAIEVCIWLFLLGYGIVLLLSIKPQFCLCLK